MENNEDLEEKVEKKEIKTKTDFDQQRVEEQVLKLFEEAGFNTKDSEEFKGIGVDDPKKCTKLKVKYTKDRRTCCGLTMKYRQDYSDIPLYSCVDFSINKKQREASIAEMNNDPRGSTYISDCTC